MIFVVGAAVVALGAPAASTAQAPAEDSVTGTAALITYAAHSGPSGENPTGYIELAVPPFTRAPVTCLTVTGNRATIGVDILGMPQYLFVEDNGSSGSDRATPFGTPADNPVVCPADPPDQPTAILQPVSGDIIVHDAQPFPTSKDQCTNGGWHIFPGFKNQGQCVSFVAAGGNKLP